VQSLCVEMQDAQGYVARCTTLRTSSFCLVVWSARAQFDKENAGNHVDDKEQEEGESEQSYNDKEQGDNVEEQEVENEQYDDGEDQDEMEEQPVTLRQSERISKTPGQWWMTDMRNPDSSQLHIQ
jgi:hypothetical protein